MWTLTLTGSGTAVAGTATLGLSAKVVGQNGSSYTATESLSLKVTLSPATLALSAASGSATVVQGKSVTDLLTLTGNPTYTGAVSLSVSGLPSGVTASFSSNPLTLSNESGGCNLSLIASASATVGSATVTVTAKGDGLVATTQVTLQVTQAPGLDLVLNSGTGSMAHTSSSTVSVTVTPVGSASGTITMSVSGLPTGVTASFGAPTAGQAGSESMTLTLAGGSTAKAGTSRITVKASIGSGANTYTASQVLTLTLQ
jgi:uncharacterized membrane protein